MHSFAPPNYHLFDLQSLCDSSKLKLFEISFLSFVFVGLELKFKFKLFIVLTDVYDVYVLYYHLELFFRGHRFYPILFAIGHHKRNPPHMDIGCYTQLFMMK